MKLTMNFKEIAAMAGVVKEVRESINPNIEKESVQQMMTKLVENFKDGEKHSFVTIKLDSSMNLVIDAEGEAVIRILDLCKKYFVAAYPMIKLLGETGMKMGTEIQEVIDDYKDPEEEKPVHVTIINIDQKKAEEYDKSGDQFFENITKGMNNQENGNNKKHVSGKKNNKSSKKKHMCPMCLHTAMIDPNKGDISCRICGQDMLPI